MRKSETVFGAIRVSKGISLEEIACSTKISIRFLRAIEEGQFQKLPGGIYDINYMRQYAQAIDADEGELLRLYESQKRLLEPEAYAVESTEEKRSRGLSSWAKRFAELVSLAVDKSILRFSDH